MKLLEVEFSSPRGLANKRTSLWNKQLFPQSEMKFDGTDFVFSHPGYPLVAVPHHQVSQYKFFEEEKKGPGRPKKE